MLRFFLLFSLFIFSAENVSAYYYPNCETRIQNPIGTINYQWDKASNKTRLTSNLGNQQINYEYDALNRVTKIIAPDTSETTLEYDQAGNRSKITRPNGIVSAYTYNAANQLTKLVHQKQDGSTIAEFTYTLDKNGRKTKAQETINGQTRTVDYQYDDTGKLTQEKVQEGATTKTTDYQYDQVGNRTQKTENGQTTTYLYNGNDQLQSETTASQTIRYQYDANGNLTQKQTPQGTIQYTWNSANRLTSINDQTNNKIITYRLDAEGRRIGKTTKEGATTTETQYLVDPARPYSEIVQTRTRVNNGTWQDTTYIHTPDGVGDLIGQSDATTNLFTLQDGQGSTRLTTDASGTTQDILTYDAFGNRADGFGRAATEQTTINHLYVGELYDEEAGLYHLRARDYDSRTGRFTSMDEFEGAHKRPLSLNSYLYANADPVNTVDPSGYFTLGGMMSGLNTAFNYYSMTTFIYDRIFGNPDDVKVDGRPTLWDALMAMAVRALGHSASFDFGTSTSAKLYSGPPRDHHTIPVYCCGLERGQSTSSIPKGMHDELHDKLYKYRIGIDLLGISFDLLIYKKPTSRINKTPLQRLGTKSIGRGAIAAGLGIFYYQYDYIAQGIPPIGIVLAKESIGFIGKKHSAPNCQRPRRGR